MTLLIADYVNDAPQSNRLGAIHDYFEGRDDDRAIDRYFKNSRSLLRYANETRLNEQPDLGRLILLGLVSEAECYFRSILATCLQHCPVCQKAAGEKNVNLGGVLWHGVEGFSRSAFEHLSFASASEMKSAAQQFLDFKLNDQKFKLPLEEFDKICHLRHAIVHNAGTLPGRNAVQLGVKRQHKPVSIVLDYGRLQDAAAVIDTLVVTLNRELFAEFCKRWAVDWRKLPDWNESDETKVFQKIWKIFISEEERRSRPGRSKITASNCMGAVKAHYNI